MQLPLPSQALGAMHALPGKLSAAFCGSLVQVPSLPATLQAQQVVVQAVSQHRPSTQLPDAHRAGLLPQLPPFSSLQLPLPSQELGAMQESVG